MSMRLEDPVSADQDRVGTWDSERTALAVEVLERSGRLRLRLRGESMLPTLWPGDEVDIGRCSPADIRQGEVLLAFRENRLFLHRVCGFSTNGDVITRGDAMPGPDPAAPAQAIVGTITQVTRMGRTFQLCQGSTAIRRGLGVLFCHSDLSRRIALKVHSWRMKNRAVADSQQNFERLASNPCDCAFESQ